MDVDFPVVYRAAAGLDSIAQAAGRCNRNGRLPMAPVYVFEPQGWRIPPETKRLGALALGEVAPLHEDMLGRAALRQYFALRFGPGAELDKSGVLEAVNGYRDNLEFPFASIAHDFELIDTAAEPVFIPYDETARSLLDALPYAAFPASILRRLQRYAVNVYQNQKKELQSRGLLLEEDGVLILDAPSGQMETLYTPEYGLQTAAQPEGLFI